MNPGKLIAKHLVFGLITVWGVLTAVFALFLLIPEYLPTRRAGSATAPGTGMGTAESSLFELYVGWVRRMATLDWDVATGGDPEAYTYAYHAGDAVMPLVFSALGRTLLYVLPALAIGFSIATLLGLYAALRPDSRLAAVGTGTSYVAFAVPTFWLGAILLSVSIAGHLVYSSLLFEYLLPIVLVTTTLLGGPLSYARAYAKEYVSAEFVKLVEAKGGSSWRVTEHVLHNAAIPMISMVFTEALGLLVLSVFVIEVVFGIEGFGLVLFGAANSRDVPVLLGCVLVVVVVGVLGNLLQDLSYGVLDPRVDPGARRE
ncbi:ABC transporter permease [Halalkaliarchaeum sp. AArc-GB]|uniref:ABC transporter permease n=1 Tax=Halalkaliarchaeum sp. AArc-GB TaxID=3074078 RepID=UPI00285D0BDE|nr:ABC transporter permease [Halalkaliarchaeum sp. AArc-GB]MDR5673992.1 ABC transporter permease [Halalkaliarchaeum sp. AArc-GB]